MALIDDYGGSVNRYLEIKNSQYKPDVNADKSKLSKEDIKTNKEAYYKAAAANPQDVKKHDIAINSFATKQFNSIQSENSIFTSNGNRFDMLGNPISANKKMPKMQMKLDDNVFVRNKQINKDDINKQDS